MSKEKHKSPSEEEFLVSIKARQTNIPNCPLTQNCVIKNGPQTYKVASILQFLNPSSGEVSHRELHLNDYPFRVGTGVQWDLKDRLKHWGCKDDEIEILRAFLETFKDADAPGEYSVIEGKPSPTIQEIFDLLGEVDSPNLAGVISILAERAEELQTLPPLGETDNRRMVAAALRASHRMTALNGRNRSGTASHGQC